MCGIIRIIISATYDTLILSGRTQRTDVAQIRLLAALGPGQRNEKASLIHEHIDHGSRANRYPARQPARRISIALPPTNTLHRHPLVVEERCGHRSFSGAWVLFDPLDLDEYSKLVLRVSHFAPANRYWQLRSDVLRVGARGSHLAWPTPPAFRTSTYASSSILLLLRRFRTSELRTGGWRASVPEPAGPYGPNG